MLRGERPAAMIATRSGNGAAITSEATRSGGGNWDERWACSRYSIDYFIMDQRG